jgi:anti-sigma factor RsiW
MTETLTCQELVELVTDYLEDALSPVDRARFEEHLAACPGCDTYVEQFRETIRLTGRLREQDIAPGARTALLEQFRNWQEPSA